MDVNAQTWVAIAAAVIAVIALYFNAQYTRAADRAARSAEAQTKIQRQLRIDAAQPYVWVDVRPDDVTGTLLNLVIGNSGPTVATNVRVQIEPPLPAIDQLRERIQAAQARLADGIRSLAPGRTIAWPLGQGFNLLNTGGPQVHTFTVTADGPFGAVPSQIYVIDLADLRGSLDRPAPLHKLAEVVEELSRTLRSAANGRTDAAPAPPGPYLRKPPRIGQPWISHRRRTPRRLSRGTSAAAPADPQENPRRHRPPPRHRKANGTDRNGNNRHPPAEPALSQVKDIRPKFLQDYRDPFWRIPAAPLIVTPPIVPAVFRKPDAVAVLTARLLPAPRSRQLRPCPQAEVTGGHGRAGRTARPL